MRIQCLTGGGTVAFQNHPSEKLSSTIPVPGAAKAGVLNHLEGCTVSDSLLSPG